MLSKLDQLHWNHWVAIIVAIGLTLEVVIGLYVTRPRKGSK